MSFLSQMSGFLSDVGTAIVGTKGDDEAADEIRSQPTVDEYYAEKVANYKTEFGQDPSAEQKEAFKNEAFKNADWKSIAERNQAALKKQKAEDPMLKFTAGDVAPGKAAAGSIGAGGTNYSSQGPSPLLMEQLGVGFVAVDPMAFLKTFR